MVAANALFAERSGLGGLKHPDRFVARHVGPGAAEQKEMAESLGYATAEALMRAVVPADIRRDSGLALPAARSEQGVLAALRSMASRNRVCRSFIGMGYYDCHTPAVIQRSILENPGWYTQYTPYQAEIAQGRLESLLNFQTMVCDLTAMEIANASLLDEATAAAEAMAMAFGIKGSENRNCFLVSDKCHPQTLAVVQTRAEPLGIEVVVGRTEAWLLDERVFAVLVQTPDTYGRLMDVGPLTRAAHEAGAMAVVATDLLALTLYQPPGESGADIVVGSAQRFGVPLGFGGPHAAFLATRDAFKRHLPGRLVGVSRDARGRPALRLALQTREQHIRREKATSNICTAQALLANIAAMYAVYHGPEGLRNIARYVQQLTRTLNAGLARLGHGVAPGLDEPFFDTLRIAVKGRTAAEVLAAAEAGGVNLRSIDAETLGVSLDETATVDDVEVLLRVFHGGDDLPFKLRDLVSQGETTVSTLERRSGFLRHAVFNRYHSETEMLRYIKRLESRDLSLTTSMIPLGSCTMKLNATSEMYPISWPEFARLHPFAPESQTAGYRELFGELEAWLAEVTGFAAVSLQPNAGSQGEYAGLLAIRGYHASRGEGHRQVCLIPTSAHGTNPASAVMAGMRVVAVACDPKGNIDLGDLRTKVAAHAGELAVLMVTYPSTHGVFEEGIREVCRMVHAGGGQVYMDGANLNAQVGWCRPAEMGADVCHLNLHKTFCIPHGGGGPGVGPIAVAGHLAAHLPGHPVIPVGGRRAGAVSAAPWGSASLLAIPWVYVAAMGSTGLREATQVAVLNANYVARRLESYFPILYRGAGGLVAHECILDLRQFKRITVEDVAKRLMDYGFHAPTVSWPVAGTMMIEPTESESKAELDRFCDALIAIHGEIVAVEAGRLDPLDNPLKRAPHTADQVAGDTWSRAYSRETAAYPAPWLREHKFWPAVGRIDNVQGDRNPVCTCVGMEAHTG